MTADIKKLIPLITRSQKRNGRFIGKFRQHVQKAKRIDAVTKFIILGGTR